MIYNTRFHTCQIMPEYVSIILPNANKKCKLACSQNTNTNSNNTNYPINGYSLYDPRDTSTTFSQKAFMDTLLLRIQQYYSPQSCHSAE